MKNKTYLWVMFTLTLAGVLFAGYLSISKAVTGTCAFNESCPYFLGYPACWYGLAMFSLMFIFSILGILGKMNFKNTSLWILGVSALGILFAGNFVLKEIADWRSGYDLGLPTCVYGLIFYILIFVFSVPKVTGKSDNLT